MLYVFRCSSLLTSFLQGPGMCLFLHSAPGKRSLALVGTLITLGKTLFTFLFLSLIEISRQRTDGWMAEYLGNRDFTLEGDPQFVENLDHVDRIATQIEEVLVNAHLLDVHYLLYNGDQGAFYIVPRNGFYRKQHVGCHLFRQRKQLAVYFAIRR